MRGLARERLIEEHLPLVRSVAAAFAHRGEPLDDLVQVGTIGLIGAVDGFEEERGCRFEAYAAMRIRGEIRRHLRDRAPRVAELAAACGLLHDEAGRALAAGRVRATVPLGGGPESDELAAAAEG